MLAFYENYESYGTQTDDLDIIFTIIEEMDLEWVKENRNSDNTFNSFTIEEFEPALMFYEEIKRQYDLCPSENMEIQDIVERDSVNVKELTKDLSLTSLYCYEDSLMI